MNAPLTASDMITAFTSIEEDLQRHDTVQDDIQSRRAGVLARLETLVDAVDFTTVPTKAGEAMAKMLPITTYLSALKDQEASARNRANLKIKKKDSDGQNATAELIAEFLRTPSADRMQGVPAQNLAEVAKELESEIDASATPVRETETRTSPDDLE